MMRALLLPVLLLPVLLMSGCVGYDRGVGLVARQNAAAQIVDPAPHYDSLDPAVSGERAERALQRYETRTVTLPVAPSTQTGSAIGAPGPGAGPGAGGQGNVPR